MWSASEIEELRRLLMEHWDPIGVHVSESEDEERAAYWDEYDDYLPEILRHLESGGDRKWLEHYLFRRRTDEIGMSPEDGRHLDASAARAVFDWNPRRQS